MATLRLVGAQVRKQPLPAGRYWITITSAQLDAFLAWVHANPTRVVIEHSEAVETQPIDRPATGVTFFIFSTGKPITFDQRSFGFPNTAGADIQSAADTVTRPPVPKPTDILNDLPDALNPLKGLGSGALLLVLAYFAFKD